MLERKYDERHGQDNIADSPSILTATHGGGYPAGGGFRHENDDDLRGAAHAATQHQNGGGESQDFFSGILNKIGGNKSNLANEDIDEGGE